jgi:dihydrofolate synthase / folylpolyglutamate synthase
MIIQPIKTRKFLPPLDKLEDLLAYCLENLTEKSILAVTSKVVSICEGQTVAVGSIKKEELIKEEADFYLDRKYVPQNLTIHTLKNGLLVRSCGIDESNANGFYILWPKDSNQSAKKIWQYLRKKTKVKDFGVVITDSISVPLRRGAIGISLGSFGFEPLKDYRGEKDLFQREFKVSVANFADSLAASAVLTMGEGSEQTPLCLIKNLPKNIKFINKNYTPKKSDLTFNIPPEEDIFAPFLMGVKWQKGDK